MDRRSFLRASGSGLGLVWLIPLGCKSTGSSSASASRTLPGVFEVGHRHLIFDGDSMELELDPDGHQVMDLDGGGAVEATFGRLGQSGGELNFPVAAACGPEGRVYVLDHGNGRVGVFGPKGRHLADIGEGELHGPSDLALDGDGNVYVADTINHRVAVFSPDGSLLRSIGGFGVEKKELNGPQSVAISPRGELHVVDAGNARVQVYSLSGEHRFSYGGYGNGKGEMLHPTSIVCDGLGRVSIADPASGFIDVFDQGGAFIDRFRPKESNGRNAVPLRLQRAPGDTIYVYTGGGEAHP